MSEKINRLSIILNRKDMERISAEDGELYVDVHGMTCKQVRKFLKNIIALIGGGITLDVIHGYNRGMAIKMMLRGKDINNITTRKMETKSVNWNPGLTRIVLA